MLRFVVELLPGLVQTARLTFMRFREVHRAYGKGEIKYTQWIRELRAGTQGWRREVRDAARSEGKGEK
jgi:hypothetical protein